MADQPGVSAGRDIPVPLVSCVIPARDAGPYLAEAIDSVLGQRYPADRIELVVVDDGSVDSTPQVLDGYGDRIRRIRHDELLVDDAHPPAAIGTRHLWVLGQPAGIRLGRL